jgi:hypothetical protein
MDESVVWQVCRRRLEASFSAAADAVRACNPRLWSRSGHRMIGGRPIEAWIELKRVEDLTRDEDVVVFFAVERDDDTLKCTVDISTGEGVVLADGPTRTIRVDPIGAWQEGILGYVADTERFLRDSYGLLRAALC